MKEYAAILGFIAGCMVGGTIVAAFASAYIDQLKRKHEKLMRIVRVALINKTQVTTCASNTKTGNRADKQRN